MTVAVTTIVDAEVDDERVDVRIEAGRVAAVGPSLDRGGSAVVDAGGGALLPGLHDHHIHLLAMAAAEGSVRLDDSAAGGPGGLDTTIRAAHGAAPRGRWLRAVGYEETHGPLDRHRLDRLAPGRPVRVQHRSGAMWVVSSPALAALGIDGEPDAGIERETDGTPTGRLHRLDGLVASRLPRSSPPDLASIGARLAGYGVTGVTDATPYEQAGAFAVLGDARRSGVLPQRIVVTGGPPLAAVAAPDGLDLGPVKVVVADNALPTVESLVAAYRAARRAGRTVAVHCVTTVALVLTLAAWDEVPALDGDRIEHGSVIPVELISRLAELGITVVTQPGFVADRGDRYLAEVDAEDQPHLYRCGSLLDATIGVAGSTDAPFGPADPWLAMRAAIDRRTATGVPFGPGEAVDARTALGLFLGPPDRPGGPPRRVVGGAAADLCLLAGPLATALAEPLAGLVRACWVDGRLAAADPLR